MKASSNVANSMFVIVCFCQVNGMPIVASHYQVLYSIDTVDNILLPLGTVIITRHSPSNISHSAVPSFTQPSKLHCSWGKQWCQCRGYTSQDTKLDPSHNSMSGHHLDDRFLSRHYRPSKAVAGYRTWHGTGSGGRQHTASMA